MAFQIQTYEDICEAIDKLKQDKWTKWSDLELLATLCRVRDELEYDIDMDERGSSSYPQQRQFIQSQPKYSVSIQAKPVFPQDTYSEDSSRPIVQRNPYPQTGYSETHKEIKASHPEITEQIVQQWARNMQNADGTQGAHWTKDQTNQVLEQKKLDYDPQKFYIALNATYSDYCEVFKKHNINNVNAYVDFAVAFWINDEDAVDDKLAAYYEYVVKH